MSSKENIKGACHLMAETEPDPTADDMSSTRPAGSASA
jgi:hypothetical protein